MLAQCICVQVSRVLVGCTAMCVVCWRRMPLGSAHGETSRPGACGCRHGTALSHKCSACVDLSRRGSCLFKARLLRRAHRIVKSCPASVAKISHHPHPLEFWVCKSPAAIVPKTEAKGASQPLIIYSRRRYPTTLITPLRAKLLLSFPTLPARREGPGPPFSSQVASSRLPMTACQKVSCPKASGGGILRT